MSYSCHGTWCNGVEARKRALTWSQLQWVWAENVAT